MAVAHRIVLLGPPGAGKGTQAAMLAERSSVPHIATGDMMRAVAKEGGELGQQVGSYLDKGHLVPDDLIIEVVENRLQKDDCGTGYLLDGFPRTLEQAEALDRLLKRLDSPLTHIMELRVPLHVLMNRLVKRGAEQGRVDDAATIVEERMRVYEAQTRPVADYYASTDRLIVINGEGTIDEIRERIAGQL